MPVELLARALSNAVLNPFYRDRLAACGLWDAESMLDLPGEVVSGHPDRHVVRVDIPGIGTCFLKRQHRVGFGERFQQWRAGFGWVSRVNTASHISQCTGFPPVSRKTIGVGR